MSLAVRCSTSKSLASILNCAAPYASSVPLVTPPYASSVPRNVTQPSSARYTATVSTARDAVVR
eukprot:3589911-Rhodomonas_salina.4